MANVRAWRLVIVLVTVLLTSLGSGAFAQSPPSSAPQLDQLERQAPTVAPRVAPSGYGALLLQLIIVVVGVCLLAYLILKFGVKKFLVPDATVEGAMEVIARLPVEPRRSILVVRVGGRHLIVGSSEGGLSSLGEMPEDDLHHFDRAAPISPFAELLRKKFQRDANETKKAGKTASNGALEPLNDGPTPDDLDPKEENSATI